MVELREERSDAASGQRRINTPPSQPTAGEKKKTKKTTQRQASAFAKHRNRISTMKRMFVDLQAPSEHSDWTEESRSCVLWFSFFFFNTIFKCRKSDCFILWRFASTTQHKCRECRETVKLLSASVSGVWLPGWAFSPSLMYVVLARWLCKLVTIAIYPTEIVIVVLTISNY